MSDERVRDAGYDDFLDAVESGSPFYLECPEDHGSLPPREVCPECGSGELEQADLPEIGTVLAHTVVHVPTPRFTEDTPYVAAIVDFGAVSVTGQISVDDPHTVDNGASVTLRADVTETNGDRLLVFDLE